MKPTVKKGILVAEDHKVLRETVVDALRADFGSVADVYAAEDGVKAFEIFKKYPINLALLDIQMGGKDCNGITAAQRMYKLDSGLVVILWSTLQDNLAEARRRFPSAKEYLLKGDDDICKIVGKYI